MRRNQVIYRHATMDDIEALVNLELEVWGDDMAADRDKWISRISIFPEGVHIAEKDERIVGVIVTHIINWDYLCGYYPSWAEATADGYITNHNDDGNVMYGVDLTVLPGMSGVASRLLQMAIRKTRERKITRGFLGCRIPSLRSYVHEKNIEVIGEKLVESIAIMDPEVRFFLQNGFRIVKVCENYFSQDEDSLGWGVILELL